MINSESSSNKAVWRPTWDEAWMRIANVMSERSKCSRAQIGCVIVADDQTVVSTGYSGPPPGYMMITDSPCINWCERAKASKAGKEIDSMYLDCPNIHAEQNAIARANWQDMKNSTAFIAGGAVCYNCAKLLAAAGVRRVVHCVLESDTHRNPEQTEQFLRECGIEVERYSM